MKNIYIAFLLFSSLVVSIPLYAMPFGESNIIVSGDNMLFEYTVEGQIVQQIPTPPIPDFTQIRDLIVTASGEVAIFNGTSDPELNLYNPQTEEWRSFKFPGWSIVNNDSNGGIAAYGDGIYVTDMMADGNGIIRFGLDGTAQRVLEGKDYVDLTLGLDGKFYALKENTSFVDIIDPELMQVIHTVQLEFAIDVRGIAVNSSGYIYTVSWNGEFAKYDSNGTQWISMPGAGSINLVDIDIDAQGRIVFHDRNNILYLTNELFVEQLISPQAINLPVVYSASSFVAFSKNDAIVQTNPNVLVSSDNRMFEYTPAGQLINEITIPSTDQVRDLIVTKNGDIAFFNGTVDPELSLFNLTTGSWRSFKFPGWSIAGDGSLGGIAAYGDYVYVTDMMSDGNGIVRFTIDGTALDGSAQRYMEGMDYTDLTVGLDGKLYALQGATGGVDILDPTTMQLIRNIQLQPANDIRGIAVNKLGQIFAVDWIGELIKFDTNGVFLNSLPIGWNISDIDINAAGKIILQDGYNNVFITDEMGINPVIFTPPVSSSALSFVAFAQNDVFDNSVLVDSDNDGMADDWELRFALDPHDPSDAVTDIDYDGLTNLQEFNAGTDPWNFDTDNDGLQDGEEVNIYATNPNNRDTDSDGISDSYEVYNQLDPLSSADALLDKDGDGLTNTREYELGTSASVLDSDGDGINDGDEVNQGLNPLDKDTDDDGLSDGAEPVLGLDPGKRDTDNNGVIDGFEYGNIIRVNPQQSYSTPGYGGIHGAAISTDGRYVAFVSESSNLVSNDTNGEDDVFWTDTLTGEIRRVSVSSSGEEGNGWSGRIVNSFGIDISDDGRFVTFDSYASNLVANDTNNTSDIFVHDIQTSVTSRVSVNSLGNQTNGSSYQGSISGDGRYVAFYSSAPNLLSGLDGNTGYETDVFVHDRQTGITTLVSKNSAGVQGNHQSTYPAISANGRYVAFSSEANNLVDSDTNGATSQYAGKDIFVHDLETGITERVSISTDGIQGDNMSDAASISADGRYIAFHSLAKTLDNNVPASYNVFVHDRILGKTERIAVDEFEGVQYSFHNFPLISSSGRYVALRASQSNGHNVFVYDRETGEVHLVSRNNNGEAIQYQNVGGDLAISADGQFVAFSTTQYNLVPDKQDFIEELFLTKTGFMAELATAPTAVITSIDASFINTAITFDASLSADPNGDPLMIDWDFGDNSGLVPGINVTHSYAVPGTYTVKLYVGDGNNPPTIATKVVTVLSGAPVVQFTSADSTFINTPEIFDASLSTDPNGDPLFFHWEFGDGTFAEGVNVSHAYATAGTYTVALHVNDVNNPPVIVTKTVMVATGAPVVQFTSADSTFINTPEIFDASLSTDPNGDPLFFHWEFGDGTFAEGVNVSHAYATAGTYTVALHVNDGNNPPVIVTKTVMVATGAPVVQFTSADSTFINTPEIFDASLSTDPNGDPLFFHWEFGDGTFAEGVNVSHAYATAGTYTVALHVNDGNNPPVIVTKTVMVATGAPTAIISSVDTDYINTPIAFDASLSSDPNGDLLNYFWDFGDGISLSGINVSHSYSLSGNYTVTLSVVDGNNPPTVTTKIVNVLTGEPTAVITSLDSVNKKDNIVFDASLSSDPNGDPLGYEWDLGDGTTISGINVSHSYVLSGNYTVQLTVFDGNTVSVVNKVITVLNQAPNITIQGSGIVNRNEILTLDATLTTDADGDALTYTWDFGDGSIASGLNASIGQNAYSSSGTFTATLTVDDGETTSTASKTITVYNQTPIAVITASDTVNKNESAVYDASLTTDPNGDALTYTWDFGGGKTATGVTVNHTFTTSGNHMVLMTVSDGEVSTNMSKSITVVNHTPVPVVTGPDIVNKNILLTLDANQSTDSNGDSLTYVWDFEDGTSKTGVSINHTFTKHGFHNVKLTVSDGESSNWVYKVIEVLNKEPDVVMLMPVSADKNSSVTFDASQSTDFDGDTLNYFWQFGDGNTAITATANHTYTSSGLFTVSLRVGDGDSEVTVTKDIMIENQGPTAVISVPDIAYKKKAVSFDANLSTDPNGDALTYSWDFGDGSQGASGDTTVYVYSASGTYTVTLTASDGDSSSSTSKLISVINQAPVAEINSSNAVNKNASASYGGQLSTDPDYDVLTYSWNFGDGTPAKTGMIVEHVYTSSGNFTVTLTASDGELSSTASKNITVYNQTPIAVITAVDTVNKNESAVYDASLTTDANGDELTYTWDFGGGVTATGVTVNHTFTTSGNHMVLMTVSDGEVSTNMSKLITVENQSPIAAISSVDSVNKQASMNYSASLSSDPNGDALSYDWSFGDGVTASGVNVSHIYSTTGSYTVTLTVNDGEASVSTSKTITVLNQAPVANAGEDQQVIHRTLVTLDGSGSHDPDIGDNLNYNWNQISGTGVTINNSTSIVTTFTAPRLRRGTTRELVFELTVTDEEGAASTDTVLIIVTR